MPSEDKQDNESASNFSVIKLGLVSGLRNDDITEDSIVTETDLNTLNTNKIMAAMIKKGDLQGAQGSVHFEGHSALNITKIIDYRDIIDEREEDDIDPMS